MSIFVDATVVGHRSSNTGNNTVPPGISGLVWARAVSTDSLVELETFLTTNLLTIGQPSTNVRTPLLGSNITYVGLSDAQRIAAVAAGAIEHDWATVMGAAFDANGQTTYEP
jgi:hypothetical protein